MILYIIWIILIFLVALYSINHPEKLNNKKIILSLLFIFFFIILGWCRGAYDVEIGISRYVNYERTLSFTEIGYNLLILLFHKFNFGYRIFFVICAFLELLVLFWFTNKNCKKPHIALCLFMIYPFVIYFQYIRTLAAIPFVLLALDSLINKNKHYIIKYIIFCLLAALFHFSSVFFLLYLPISFMSKKGTIISTLIGIFILKSVSSISFLYNIVNMYLGEEKVGILERSISASGMFGRIFGVVASILFFYIIVLFLKLCFKINFNDRNDKLFFKINFISFLCIPLALHFGVGFARIPTLLFIFNYPYLVNKVSEVFSQKKRILVYFVILLYLIGLLFINYHNKEYLDLVLRPFFEQNELINSIFE